MAPGVPTGRARRVEGGLEDDPQGQFEPRWKRTAIAGLPHMLSTFRGRTGELAELAELSERFRLVTVTGAPGVGETRLARDFSAGRSGSATFVDLARAGVIDPFAAFLLVTAPLCSWRVPTLPAGKLNAA